MSYQYTLDYQEPINADVLRITFDGVTYECQKNIDEGDGFVYYGAPWDETLQDIDFSEYPFALLSDLSNLLYTETSGTHTISVESVASTAEVSDCFRTAVESISGSGGGNPLIVTLNAHPEAVSSEMNATFAEIEEAYSAGRTVIATYQGDNKYPASEWAVVSVGHSDGSTPVATKSASFVGVVKLVDTDNMPTNETGNGTDAVIYTYRVTSPTGLPLLSNTLSHDFHKVGCLHLTLRSNQTQTSGTIDLPNGNYSACIISVYAVDSYGAKSLIDWSATTVNTTVTITATIAEPLSDNLEVYVHYHLAYSPSIS